MSKRKGGEYSTPLHDRNLRSKKEKDAESATQEIFNMIFRQIDDRPRQYESFYSDVVLAPLDAMNSAKNRIIKSTLADMLTFFSGLMQVHNSRAELPSLQYITLIQVFKQHNFSYIPENPNDGSNARERQYSESMTRILRSCLRTFCDMFGIYNIFSAQRFMDYGNRGGPNLQNIDNVFEAIISVNYSKIRMIDINMDQLGQFQNLLRNTYQIMRRIHIIKRSRTLHGRHGDFNEHELTNTNMILRPLLEMLLYNGLKTVLDNYLFQLYANNEGEELSINDLKYFFLNVIGPYLIHFVDRPRGGYRNNVYRVYGEHCMRHAYFVDYSEFGIIFRYIVLQREEQMEPLWRLLYNE